MILIYIFSDRFTDNPWAFNMLGLLLERKQLYKGSAEAFYKALELLGERNENNTSRLDKILLNYSRVLSNMDRYEEAIKHLKLIKIPTFANQCELAFAFFKAKFYEDSYSSYETTLEWFASDTEMKSHILVAMAAVVYLHQGHEDAKILLMQSLVST